MKSIIFTCTEHQQTITARCFLALLRTSRSTDMTGLSRGRGGVSLYRSQKTAADLINSSSPVDEHTKAGEEQVGSQAHY